ncbi:MAG: tetratricopeptide repeat protein [Fibrobacter sp.]|nr:tetratricopeptide repeat protein [Fibrobacter sp.]
MRRVYRCGYFVAVVISTVLLILPQVGFAQDAKRAELMEKIKKLEAERAKLRADAEAKITAKKGDEGKIEEIIARYEKLLQGCNVKKSDRCADVIYTLAGLYYDQGKDQYVRKREEYEKAMAAYDKNPRGPEPVNPIPDYSKALAMYERVTKEYPAFPKLSEAYYQMGTIYLLMGQLDKTKDAFLRLVEKFPNSPRASGAHFRLAELAYLDNDYSTAIKHLEKVREDQIDVSNWEMVHYRKGEVYYNIGELDKAVVFFQTYVDKCDAGLYPKREFRDMAVEFMAISFSDMENGADEAISFFKKLGKRSYEDIVMYTIGLKNRTHGQFDAAILSLQTALKKFPLYKDAPAARMALIECYVVKKEHEKANQEREKLVDDYGPGSAWYKANSGNPAEIEKSQAEVRRALGHIAIYYHALAQKKKDKAAFEKAIKRYNEFFQRFPEDKWRVYEFKYNIAELYSSIGDCGKSAENYDFVAAQDLKTYPEFKKEIDTLGMDADEAEKRKSETGKSPVAISQEDAGYNAIVAYDACRKKEMQANDLNDEKAYTLASTKNLLDYCEKFQIRFPKSSNAAEVLYLAGNIHYSGKSYDNAIRLFKQIADNYPTSKVADKASRMLANSYSSAGKYDMAMGIYKGLLKTVQSNTSEYAEILDLAAGALFKRAEALRKDGNLSGAADVFKSIATEYPASKVADRGWFEAGVCYEEAKNYENAAMTLEELASRFPKSTLREKAYLRAADNYKKVNRLDRAAQVYQTAANNITNAEFAIPSLSSASDCYQQLNQFDMAGKMFEMIYERYSSDPKTPQALYNAGLIFEKGKFYPNAINVYDILAKRFPDNEYAAEAFFSIGLCYEKMNENEKMANVFSEYATKFPNDRYKQVQALVKAGDAYFNLKKFDESEKNYVLATSVYEKFKSEVDLDVASIAQAYFKIGEIKYSKFLKIKLVAKAERDMKNLIKEKTKALEEPAKQYAKAIELGVAEWTVRSTYMIGMGFVDMAEAVDGQTLFGTAEQKIVAKIQILASLDKYYEKALEYFYKNIEWAHTQNIKGEYVEKSMDRFAEMLFRRGHIMEQVGIEWASAPIPKGLSPDEVEAYRQLLEEKRLEAQDAAVPKYAEGIMALKEQGIAKSQWLDKMRERISDIDPSNKVLEEQITEWVPSENPTPVAQSNAPGSKQRSQNQDQSNIGSMGIRDEEFERNSRRIKNIMSMNIAVEEKIKQLNRIEMEAKRNIVFEEEKISELKGQIGM